MAIIIMTPGGFYESVFKPLENIMMFSSQAMEPWPNAFTLVRETQPTTIKSLVTLSGNPLTALVAIAGCLTYGWNCFHKKPDHYFGFWAAMTMIFIVLLVLSLKTVRFSLLFVLPLSIFVIWGVHYIISLTKAILHWLVLKSIGSIWKNALVFSLLSILMLPLQVAYAKSAVSQNFRVVNDTWFDLLSEVKSHTPAGSTMVSWWSSGYFIHALSRHKTFTDPGSQHVPNTYWAARFYLSQDENEAIGILRMLNTDGHDGVKLLNQWGWDLPQSMEQVINIVSLSREEAAMKLKHLLDSKAIDDLLSKTHGSEMPPTFVLVYYEMVKDNMAMTLTSRWNFKKASMLYKMKKGEKQAPQDYNSYFRESVDISGGLVRYEQPSNVLKQDGDFLYFQNGFRVNLETMDAFVKIPNRQIEARPHSLFYLDGDQLREKVFTGNRIGGSAFLWQEEGKYQALIAEPELIRSILFRLYYMKGAGLKHFKPLISKKDFVTGGFYMIYEVDFTSSNTTYPSEASTHQSK